MINSTYSREKFKPLTIKDLEKAAKVVSEHKEPPLPKGLGWFSRLMAKFGWHRQYKVLIFDKSQFDRFYFRGDKKMTNQEEER